MSGPTQVQLEEFARRLRALEAELESWKRLAHTEPERAPAPPPVEIPPVTPVPEPAPVPAPGVRGELAWIGRLLAEGRADEALRKVEELRAGAYAEQDRPQLLELRQLARAAATRDKSGSTGDAARRLVYAISQNLQFLGATGAPSVSSETARSRPLGEPLAPRASGPASPPQPAVAPTPPRPAWVSRLTLPELTLSDLLGARALALAGGIVTLLGIVFFFVLAVNRGWVGPEGRVALGAAASILLFLGGLELHRRYGETYSSLAAVGAGIAGGYATLLASAALYDLLPAYAALVVAGGIGAAGVATSVAWRSQIVAGLGLVGAMLVPVAVVAQGGLSPLGTAFVCVVFAATATVALRLGWRSLLVAGAVVSAPQVVALVAQSEYDSQAPWRIVVVAAAFTLVYAATGIACQLRSAGESLDPLASALIAGAAAVAGGSAVRLFGTTGAQGAALLVVAAAYGAAAGLFFIRREAALSALLAAVAFVLGGFAFADLLSGRPLAYAWAAEAAALSWLARRVREVRFQLWAAVYLVLCTGHVLAVDARLRLLFTESDVALGAAASAFAVALGAAGFCRYAGPWPQTAAQPVFPPLDRLVAAFAARQRLLQGISFWLAASFATYALSLGAVAVVPSFDWAFVPVTAIWAVAGLAIAIAGLTTGSGRLRQGSAVWLLVVGLAVVLHSDRLGGEPLWCSFLVLAAVLFSAGLACQLLDARPSGRTMDAALCAAAAAVVIGAIATAGLLGGQVLAATWAAEAAVLAWGARRLRAPHLTALVATPLGLALVHLFAFDAPPRRLFVETAGPADGVPAVLAVTVAAVAIATQLVGWRGGIRAYDELAVPMRALLLRRRGLRSASLWLAGVTATYAASLGLIAASASFDWCWVALAGLWSAIALALLFAGLRVDSAQLTAGGLAWLGLTTLVVLAEGQLVLAASPRCAAFLVVAAALLIATLAYALQNGREPLDAVTVAATLSSLGLTTYSIHTLLAERGGAVDLEGLALLALATLYGGIAAALLHRPGFRDLTTLFWGIGAILGGVSAALLLDGTFTVLAWAAASVALAWLSTRKREPRFVVAASGFLGLTLAHALALEAPPSDLFTARIDPGSGAPAVLISAAALAAVAYFAGDAPARARRSAAWVAGVLAVYGLSLAILQLAETVFNAGLQSEFQRGHTAVSAFWGLLGLVLLYAGLTRWRALRVAGLALFALSLGKIFLYDLPSLSSVERALSFLAVGAVLLLGGFFYQRLSAGRTDAAAEPEPGPVNS